VSLEIQYRGPKWSSRGRTCLGMEILSGFSGRSPEAKNDHVKRVLKLYWCKFFFYILCVLGQSWPLDTFLRYDPTQPTDARICRFKPARLSCLGAIVLYWKSTINSSRTLRRLTSWKSLCRPSGRTATRTQH